MSEDHMEMGGSGMVPLENGWWLDTATGNKIDEEGKVFNKEGDLIWDPSINDAL